MAEIRGQKEQSSLGRIMQRCEVQNWDEIFFSVCEGCAVKEACDASSAKCNALSAIGAMAVEISVEPMPELVAPAYATRLEKVLKSIRR